ASAVPAAMTPDRQSTHVPNTSNRRARGRPAGGATAPSTTDSLCHGVMARRPEEAMEIGVMFPQNEIGTDVENIRAFIDAAARCGCRHVWATDHVVGADTARRP